jgi:hypothetical protein
MKKKNPWCSLDDKLLEKFIERRYFESKGHKNGMQLASNQLGLRGY